MTQVRERDSKLWCGPVWRQTWVPGEGEAGCCLRLLPTEILRSQAGPGVETGAGLMTLLQTPLAPAFPFWPVVLGHPRSRSERQAACSGG